MVILLVIGVLFTLIGGAWLFFLAFNESILWGLGCLLLWPTVPIAFALSSWQQSRIPLGIHLAGILILVARAVTWAADAHADGLW